MNISQVNVQQSAALWALKQSMQIAAQQANPALLKAAAPAQAALLDPAVGTLLDVKA